MDSVKSKFDQQVGLMEAMSFSDKDLDANRRLELSDNQRHRLRVHQMVGALGWWFVAIVGVLPLIFPNRWLPSSDTNQLMCLSMVVLGVGMAFWRQYQISHALKESEVSEITSSIQKTSRYENGHRVYRAIIEGKEFKVNEKTYNCLMEDRNYSFYYLPQTGELLSIGLQLSWEEKKRLRDEKLYDTEKQKRLAGLDVEVQEISALEEKQENDNHQTKRGL